MFHPFPKSHSGQANASSSSSGRENGETEAVRRSSCGWNAVDLVNSNIASLKEQSARGPWDVLLDLAECEGAGWRGPVQNRWGLCSAARWELAEAVCCPRPCVLMGQSDWPRQQTAKAKKHHSFLNVSMTVVKAQREFSRWIHGCRFAVLFVYVSLLTLGLGTLNHWKSHLHNSICR